MGGVLGDSAAQRWPNHGRIYVAQFSVFSGATDSLVVGAWCLGGVAGISIVVVMFFVIHQAPCTLHISHHTSCIMP